MCGWCLIKFRILLEIQRTPPWFLRSRLGDALASRRFSNLGVRPAMPFKPMASPRAVRRCQGVGWTPQEGEGDAHRRKTGAATLRSLGKSHAPVHARGKRTGSCARREIAGIYPTRARRTPLRRREIEKGGKRGKRGREERGGRTWNLAAGGGISGGRSWNPASRPLHSPSSRWFLCSTSARSSAPLLPLLHPPAESRSALARLRLTSAALPLKDSWVVGSWLLSLLHLTSAQSQRYIFSPLLCSSFTSSHAHCSVLVETCKGMHATWNKPTRAAGKRRISGTCAPEQEAKRVLGFYLSES